MTRPVAPTSLRGPAAQPAGRSSAGPDTGAHPLTLVRAVRGWSLETTARRIAQRAVALGLGTRASDKSKVWRWERRGVVPDLPTQHALANLLGVPSTVVASTPWPHWLPAPATGQAHLGLPASPSAASALPRRDTPSGALTGHAEVLRAVADWFDEHPVPGAGAINAAPDGAVSVHVESLTAGPPPADVLRRYAETLPAATLTSGVFVQVTDRVRARPVRLHVPTPGVQLVLWCFELAPPEAGPTAGDGEDA